MSRIAVPVKPCVQRQFQVLLFGLQSVVCSDLVVQRRSDAMDLLVRHAAAVSFEINRIGRRCDKRKWVDSD